MNIREFADQFSILVLSSDLELGPKIKTTLAQGKYETYFIDSESSLFERLEQLVPHLIVLTSSTLRSSLTEFVSCVNQVSQEILLVVVDSTDQFQIQSSFSDHGIVEILPEKISQLDERVLWAVDRACEKLYLTYQNEELYSRLKGFENTSSGVREGSARFEVHPEVPVVQSLNVPDVLSSFHNATNSDELLQIMVNFISQSKVIFLKYFEGIQSFVGFQSNFGSAEEIQSIGCQLKPPESNELAKQMSLGIVPVTLKELSQKVFAFSQPQFWPLVIEIGKVEGVMISEGGGDEALKADILNRWSLFSLVYKNFILEKKREQLEVFDSTTECYNEKFYIKKIEEEFSRAKRTQQPLSLLKFSLDDEAEISKTLGEVTRNNILKKLVQLAQKTSRTHDFVCRTGLNEFTLILPYCEKKGAEIRAERLRRLFESQSLSENGLKMTISIGASEYPSLCATYQRLDETAKKAMLFIQSKGGNRLCFYKAPGNHVPEFIVRADVSSEKSR